MLPRKSHKSNQFMGVWRLISMFVLLFLIFGSVEATTTTKKLTSSTKKISSTKTTAALVKTVTKTVPVTVVKTTIKSVAKMTVISYKTTLSVKTVPITVPKTVMATSKITQTVMSTKTLTSLITNTLTVTTSLTPLYSIIQTAPAPSSIATALPDASCQRYYVAVANNNCWALTKWMIDSIAPQNCDLVFNNGLGLCDMTGAQGIALSQSFVGPIFTSNAIGPTTASQTLPTPFPLWFPNPSATAPASVATITVTLDVNSQDNSPVLQAALNSAVNGGAITILGQGANYKFKSAIVIGALIDFTFDGNGNKFVFSLPTINPGGGLFNVPNGCTRCKFRNYILDWDWATWRIASNVQFISVSPTEWTFEMIDFPRGATVDLATIRGWFVFTPLTDSSATSNVKWAFGDRNAREVFFLNNEVASVQPVRRAERSSSRVVVSKPTSTSTSKPTDMARLMRIPPNAKVVRTNVTASKVQGNSDGIGTETLTSNIIKLTFSSPLNLDAYTTPRVGSIWLARHFTYEIHSHVLSNVVDFTLEDVWIQSAPGKAVAVLDGSQRVTLRRVKVVPPPIPPEGTTRTVSVAADGFFFARSHGQFVVEDSEISQTSDDCLNVNNPTSFGIIVGFDRTIITLSNSPNWHVEYAVGDTIRFYTDEFARAVVGYGPGSWMGDGSTAQVVSASYQSNTWTLQLDRSIPSSWTADVQSRIVVWNTRYDNGQVLIKNTYCHHNRARGMLIQVNDVVVNNCVFEWNQRTALAVRSSTYWAESTGVRRVAIVGNTLTRVDVDGGSGETEGAIVVDDDRLDSSLRALYDGAHGQLLFSGNVMQENTRRAWNLRISDDVLVTNNVIINRLAQAINDAQRGVFRSAQSINVALINNVWTFATAASGLLSSALSWDASGRVGANQVYIS